MKCPKCGGKLRVVDSRPLQEGVWRRRKCAKGHLSYTTEEFTAPPTREAGLRRVPVRKPKPKPKPKPTKGWELVVTENSPLWLRSLAMELDRR